MKKLISLIMLVLMTGCTTVGQTVISSTPVVSVLDRDLARTVEIAEKYGRPEVAQCAKYLQSAISGDNALLAEETDGLFSLALKFHLLAQQTPVNEEAFKAQCGAVSAGLLLQAARGMRR